MDTIFINIVFFLIGIIAITYLIGNWKANVSIRIISLIMFVCAVALAAICIFSDEESLNDHWYEYSLLLGILIPIIIYCVSYYRNKNRINIDQ